MFINITAPCVTPVKVGQELVMLPQGNYARRSAVNGPLKGTVTKIGRKYFYVGDKAFDIETGRYVDRESYNGSYLLFPSMEAYRTAVEAAWEKAQMAKLFDDSNYSLRAAISPKTLAAVSRLLHGCGVLWTCTDSDCMQFRRTLNEEKGVFELYQVSEGPEDEFFIAHGVVHLCDVSNEERAELISSYGWDMETIQSDAFSGLLAEAVFETDIASYKQKGGYTSFEKAATDICRNVGVPPELFL